MIPPEGRILLVTELLNPRKTPVNETMIDASEALANLLYLIETQQDVGSEVLMWAEKSKPSLNLLIAAAQQHAPSASSCLE